METLPNEIKYKIYEYIHQLNYKDIIDQLKSITIKCLKMDFDINVRMFGTMGYRNDDNLFYKCLAFDCLSPLTSAHILKTIKDNTI